jgi:hypothetical protein
MILLLCSGALPGGATRATGSGRNVPWSSRLLALDARTGAVVAERALTPDVWHLAIASVPASVLPLGDLHPTACRTAR